MILSQAQIQVLKNLRDQTQAPHSAKTTRILAAAQLIEPGPKNKHGTWGYEITEKGREALK